MFFFFFNNSATTEIYTLSLHDALPISGESGLFGPASGRGPPRALSRGGRFSRPGLSPDGGPDRKSTRLNSSHSSISYAVFCLKKKTTKQALAKNSSRSQLTLNPDAPPL